MDISFLDTSLEEAVNSEKELRRLFDKQVAKKIMMRMGVLRAAGCLAQVPHTPPEMRHELKRNRKGQFAVDTTRTSGIRIIFKPDHDPVPVKDDGGIDLTQVSKIVILEIRDYHN